MMPLVCLCPSFSSFNSPSLPALSSFDFLAVFPNPSGLTPTVTAGEPYASVDERPPPARDLVSREMSPQSTILRWEPFPGQRAGERQMLVVSHRSRGLRSLEEPWSTRRSHGHFR